MSRRCLTSSDSACFKKLLILLIRNSQDKAISVSSHWRCKCRIGPFPRNSGCSQLPNVVSSHFLASATHTSPSFLFVFTAQVQPWPDLRTNADTPWTPSLPQCFSAFQFPVQSILYCQRGFPTGSLRRSCVTIWLRCRRENSDSRSLPKPKFCYPTI